MINPQTKAPALDKIRPIETILQATGLQTIDPQTTMHPVAKEVWAPNLPLNLLWQARLRTQRNLNPKNRLFEKN